MPQMAPRENLAALFIPDKDDGINALEWRIALVHSEKLYLGSVYELSHRFTLRPR